MKDIKEKPAAKAILKEKAKAVPKELVHRGVEGGVDRLRTQLRDTVQQGQQDDYGGNQFEDGVADGVFKVERGAERLLAIKKRQSQSDSSGRTEAVETDMLPCDNKTDCGDKPNDVTVKTRDAYREHLPGQEPEVTISTEQARQKRAVEQGRQAAQKSVGIKHAQQYQLTQRISDTNGPFEIDCPSSVAPAKETPAIPAKAPTVKNKSEVRLPKAKVVSVQGIKSKHSPATGLNKATDQTGQPFQTSQRVVLPMQRNRLRVVQGPQVSVKAMGKSAKTAVEKSFYAIKAAVSSTKSLIAAITAGGWAAVLAVMVIVLFGGVLSMVGGENVSATLPVSEKVEAYEPLIRQYATEYGIPEYVELIKAIMMQESGGRGLDPMQASESGYNTRYPDTAGSITDPEYSIQCGVQTIRDVLERAGVESPLDMEHIKLALQGYNFGPGYITWAVSNYGGYSLSNAEEFSTMMAERLGWERYGDTQYVPHVLRYYIFGRIAVGTGNDTLVQIALSQEGNSGDTYWSWYGFDSRVEWCACFVSWCADQCGLIDAGVVPKFSLCSDGAAWFAGRGWLMDGSYVPSPGDIVFFDWGADGSINHVGIVEYVSDGKVYTIEGNSGDRLRRKNYSLGSVAIYGYGVFIN